MKKSQVMVKERYTGFQLHWVNDSDGLNADDIDYAFAANGSSVSLYMILNGLYKPLYLIIFSFCAQSLIFCFVNITQFKFLALSIRSYIDEKMWQIVGTMLEGLKYQLMKDTKRQVNS
jgi:hypothetical protein